MAKYNIATGFYESSSKSLASQQCINFYPQVPITSGASGPLALFSTPGVSLFSNLGLNTGFRGNINFLGKIYAVNGGNLYAIDQAGTFILIGVISGTARVSIAQNGLVICIVVSENGDGYFYDPILGLSKITDPNYLGARTVTFIDGMFVFNTDKILSGRDEIFIASVTEVNKGKDFNALSFGTAEISPDAIVSMKTIRNQLYAFGVSTIEVFRNAGLEGFPFLRVPGANNNKGLPARFGVSISGNGYIFIGSSLEEGLAIWRGTSVNPDKISTPAIDNILLGLTDSEVSGINTFIYSEGGNFFFAMVLPNTTFFYDIAVSATLGHPIWHERQTNGNKWRFDDSIRMFGYNLLFSNIDGKIGKIDNNISNEIGDIPLRTASGEYIQAEGHAIFINEMELLGEAGVGGMPGEAGNNPQVSLSWSDDGGNSFSSPQPRGMGLKNDFTHRTIWRRLGRVPKTRIFRITWDSDDRFSANALWMDVS